MKKEKEDVLIDLELINLKNASMLKSEEPREKKNIGKDREVGGDK
jgi:hypothetical protein